MSIAMKMVGPCAHELAPRAWKGKLERDRQKDEGVAIFIFFYFDM